MRMNGLSASQFNMPAVQQSFKESVAAGAGTNASCVTIDSVARRSVSIEFHVETETALRSYLSSSNFVATFNTAVVTAGVSGVVVKSITVTIASQVSTEEPTAAPVADDPASEGGNLMVVGIAAAAGVVVLVGLVLGLVCYCRSRDPVSMEHVGHPRLENPMITVNVITDVGIPAFKADQTKDGRPAREAKGNRKTRKGATKYKLQGPPPPYAA